MTDVEDQLELHYGYGFEPASELDRVLLAIDALAAGGLLTPERAQHWRERYARTRPRARAASDPSLRSACLALLDRYDAGDEGVRGAAHVAHLFSEIGLISREDAERANARLYDLPDDEPVPRPRYEAPLAVALGPPSDGHALRVIWIATFDTAIDLGLHTSASTGLNPSDLALHDAANTDYEPQGWEMSMQRGHIRFTPRPTTPTVELHAGDTSIPLTVP